MENGSVGEARTKAFLIDRFWVLERSVDVDGADFLIQRRTTSHRFTDKTPPRVGIVQAKYFQDRRTTHYIPKDYVLDEKGRPLEGFFAILHLGREDEGAIYLLSAEEIIGTLAQTDGDDPKRFIVGAKALDNKYKVTSRRLALDRIEHSLKLQTLAHVTLFLDRLHIPYRPLSDDAIDFQWTLPLPNTVASIPKLFREHKERLKSIVFDMEEVLQAIDAILVCRNPHEAIELLAEIRRGVDGHGRLTFGRGYEDFAGRI